MRTSTSLQCLFDLAGPLWAGEIEVVSTYFDAGPRSPETDQLWLRRQCYKELWGSGVGDRDKGLFQAQTAFLDGVYPTIDRGIDRHRVLAAIDALRGEFAHYCLFADIHDSFGGPVLDPSQLSGWPADDELAHLRYRCRDSLGVLGEQAVRFTEGGCGALYRVGRSLSGRGDLEDRIARACEQVYRDEIDHMREGFVALARSKATTGEWDHIRGSIRRILVQRLHMRNEQLSFPVAAARIRAIEAGDIEPMKLDETLTAALADPLF